MADSIRIKVLRPLHLGARVREAGEVLALPALEAAQVLESGRGALCDAADATRVREAVAADVLRTMRRHGLAGHGTAPNPWQPLPLR